MEKLSFFILLCFLVFAKCFEYKVVDLTHKHGNDSIYWPTHTGFELIYSQRGYWDYGLWVAANTIKTTEHLGTHMDAPQHFNEFSWTMDQVPIDHLVGPGVVVDVKEKVASNSDYQVTKADLEAWEDKYGKIPDGAIVLMNSGWHDKYPNKTLVFGSNTLNDRTSYHFPGWHIDAIKWLVGYRSIHVLGSDTPSFDYAQTKRFPVHVLVSKENICGLENVAYLDKIPASGTIISAAPMKIVDGSGSPTRVYALVPQGNAVGRNQAATMLILFISVLSILFIT